MGIQNFRIIFDKPMYMVGDDVTGRAVLSVIGKDEKIRSIKIQVSGISSVTWWEVNRPGQGPWFHGLVFEESRKFMVIFSINFNGSHSIKFIKINHFHGFFPSL